LETKSKAPAFMAATALSMLPWAVIMATGSCGNWLAIWRTRSMPSPSGRRMSVRQRSKVSVARQAPRRRQVRRRATLDPHARQGDAQKFQDVLFVIDDKGAG
jgi:threonine synthase